MGFETDMEKWGRMLDKASSDQPNRQRTPKCICPRTYDAYCPICSAVDKLPRLDSKEEWQARQNDLRSKGFIAQARYYMNIILTSDPSKVLLFEGPPTIGEGLAKLQGGENDDFVDFMHPIRGRNIYIEKIGGGRTPRYKVQPRVNSTALSDKAVLKRLYDLDDLENLFDDRNVDFMRAAQFDDDETTEIRVLPNWKFVVSMKDPEMKVKYEQKWYAFFLRTLHWHYGVGPDEMAMYINGDLRLPIGKSTDELLADRKESSPFGGVERDEGGKKGSKDRNEDDIPFGLGERPNDSSGTDSDGFGTESMGHDGMVGEVEAIPFGDDEFVPAEAETGAIEDLCFGDFDKDSIVCEQCDKAKACEVVGK